MRVNRISSPSLPKQRPLSRAARLSRPGLPHSVESWTLATVLDGAIVLGVLSVICGSAGIGSDDDSALLFAVCGVSLASSAAAARRRVARPALPPPRHVISGIGVIWLAYVAIGTAVYMLTGSLTRIDDALVEAAAGFTTTAATILDPDEASRSALLWRASTSWVGGLSGIMVSVVALPNALRGTALLSYTSSRRGRDLAPRSAVGLRRVLAIYTGFTAVCVLGYWATGVEPLEAVVIGMGTASTGGFSPRADSMAGYGPGTAAVATAGMLLAGSSVFVFWWILRGQARPLLRSQELRTYAILVLAGTAIIVAAGGIGVGESGLAGDALGSADEVGIGEALFTTASVLSTTGYAVSDWTLWPATALTVLMIATGVGAMMGSAGGGMQVLRIRLLFGYVRRELLRQLHPNAVALVRCDGQPVSERALANAGSHQITQALLISFGAVVLGFTGLSVTGSLWASLSAVCTLGPAAGEIGAYGELGNLARPSRIALVPLMLAGRVAILPLLAVLGTVVQWPDRALRQMRWLMWRRARRIEASRSHDSARRAGPGGHGSDPAPDADG